MAPIEVDVRITLDQESDDSEQWLMAEERVVHTIAADLDGAKSVVVLRNDGFGNLLPDEDTRQDKT